MARSHNLLEDPHAQRLAVAQAAEALVPIAAGRRNLALWLELAQLLAAIGQEEPARLLGRLAGLREPIQRDGDAPLRCEFASAEIRVLSDHDSFDEAWLAAEELERCAKRLGARHLEAIALASMGEIAAAVGVGTPSAGAASAAASAADYFARALAVLGHQPARFRRGLIEYSVGIAERDRMRYSVAQPHLERARALSQELGDRAGIAAADIAIARVHLELGELERMPALLREARRLLAEHDDGSRMSEVMTLNVLALARAKRPQVLAEIEQARRWDRATLPAQARARFARALAEGYASQGQWQRAYAELERASAIDKAGKAQARDSQVQRLRSRYETVQRDAEYAALRHSTERAQLALDAQTARQRVLWLLVVVLAVLATAGGTLAWRGYRRRRTLLELALKDPLTGSPNRRAVTAYAQAQLEQTRRLSMPLSIAMIDLDHFKRVNDTHGHATGDELLRAFAGAAGQVLRGQDRLGRWGGEEWLLVMPGTPQTELPFVFQRLRERFTSMPVQGMPSPHGCTFSMGGVTADADGTNLNALIALADQRLYRAKAEGRDAVR